MGRSLLIGKHRSVAVRLQQSKNHIQRSLAAATLPARVDEGIGFHCFTASHLIWQYRAHSIALV
jgi:hypothetical protein